MDSTDFPVTAPGTTADRIRTDHSNCKIGYSEEFDCYYCVSCDVWLEELANCSDPECMFCTQVRPDRPSDIGKIH